jgi:hypothetical protein
MFRLYVSFIFNFVSYRLPVVAVDVIKTRYMSDSKGKYQSPLCAIRLTYQEAGIRGFFKVGFKPPCYHSVIDTYVNSRPLPSSLFTSVIEYEKY